MTNLLESSEFISQEDDGRINVIVGDPPYSAPPWAAQLAKLHVPYPRWKRLLEKIEYSRLTSREAAEPHCLLVIGDTGVGKSTLIEKYLESHPPRETTSGRVMPVLFCELPEPITIKAMAEELLAALGDPMCGKGTLHGMTRRLDGLIKSCKVEIIILDEFQHFIDRDKKKTLISVSDWLKARINKTKVPIVLVGMPESTQVLTQNPQLARRFTAKSRLAPFEWRDDKKDEFIKFLTKVAEQLPLKNAQCLYSKDTAQRMYWASSGRAAYVMKTVRWAAQEALKSGRDTLELRDFAKAYEAEIASEEDDPVNPFTGPVPEIDAFGVPVRRVTPAVDNVWKKKQRSAVGRRAPEPGFIDLTSGRSV